MKNVLYVGMEDDIILPFLVEPDFDNLYVINDLDISYAGSWNEMIDRILSILENGSDEFIEKPVEHPMTGLPTGKIRNNIAKLPDGSCKILSSNTEEAKKFELYKYKESTNILKQNGRTFTFEKFLTKDENQCWKITFEYGGKVRTMTYYLRNFQKKWPEEVNHIDALIWCSAFKFKNLILNTDNIVRFKENMETRCNLPLNIYSDIDYFPYVTLVNTSKYVQDRLITKLILKNFKKGWWEKDYSLKN